MQNRSPHRRAVIRNLGAIAMTCVARPISVRAGDIVPQPVATNLVRTAPTSWNGRECLSIELTDDEAETRIRLGQGGGNRPSYAIVGRSFADGVLEVDLGAELTGKGPPDARGFVGMAFHISEGSQTYECIYLRMTNGRLNVPAPPAPRNERAIQYVAHPDLHFAVSREQFPGRYERGADIAIGRWHRLRLEVQAARVRALVDGVEVLLVNDLRYPQRHGAVGLWIGDGTRGLFKNLNIVS
jgi:hypothetical protein